MWRNAVGNVYMMDCGRQIDGQGGDEKEPPFDSQVLIPALHSFSGRMKHEISEASAFAGSPL